MESKQIRVGVLSGGKPLSHVGMAVVLSYLLGEGSSFVRERAQGTWAEVGRLYGRFFEVNEVAGI